MADAKDTREVLKRIPKFAIIIDDKESICEYLNQNNIKTIWLNKTNGHVNLNFETIHSLLDLNLLYF